MHCSVHPAERRSGCPVIHLDTVRDRPVGEWMADLNELREASPIHWNEHGGYWVLTRAGPGPRGVPEPGSCSPTTRSRRATPIPRYKWIPSNINPPTARPVPPDPQPRLRPGARRTGRAEGPHVLPDGDRRGRRQRDGATTSPTVGGVFPTRVFLELVDLPWQDAPLFVDVDRDDLRRLLQPARRRWWHSTSCASTSSTSSPTAGGRHATRSTTSPVTCWPPRSTAQPMPDEDVLNIFNQLVLAGLDTVKSALVVLVPAPRHARGRPAASRRRPVDHPVGRSRSSCAPIRS